MKRLRCRYPFEPWQCSVCGAETTDRPPPSVVRGLCCGRCLDRGGVGEPFVPLTVKPAGPAKTPERRPILAVSVRDDLAVTEQAEAFNLRGLVERVREREPGELGRAGPNRPDVPDRLEPSIVVADRGLDLLAYLDNSKCAASPFWQWHVAIRSQTSWRPEAKRRRAGRPFLMPKPVRFGYASRRDGKQRAHGLALWHLLIDPQTFCELPDGWGDLDPAALLKFGVELRQWANDNQLPILQSAASYGARLLRDSRFADGWRRKIPGATNRRLRRRLPGNHYQLLGPAMVTFAVAHKWDQANAHHHAAIRSRFPHADELEAHGHFRTEPPKNGSRMFGRGAIRVRTPAWDRLINQPGVFHVAVSVPPQVAADPLQIPALRRPGITWQTLTSVEIGHVRELADDKVRLLDIHTCWTSPDDDDRLREFGWWAVEQLHAAPAERRRWLKPTLLAAYGMLAARPARFRNGWKWCNKPTGSIGWGTPTGQLIGLERAAAREREPQTANVLWRAIIESAVRLESLKFARELRAGGMNPIAVYADAVFAVGVYDPEHRLALPWRYEGTIHGLEFETPARYRSQEETRLPGSPRREQRMTVHSLKTSTG